MRPGTRGAVRGGLLAALVILATVGGSAARGDDPGYLPDERSYVVFDAVFLQRDNAAKERPLVVDVTSPETTLISGGDPASTIGSGARLLYGDHGPEDLGWEVGYLGVWNMLSDRTATSAAGTLAANSAAFGQQTGMAFADFARTTDLATLNSIEANVVWHSYDGGFNRRSGRPAQRYAGYDGGSLDWIGGFRWVNLEDSAVLAVTPTGAPQASTYSARTSSNLFAGQVGVRGRMAFERWGVEGFSKIGLGGTSLSQSQSLFDVFAPDSPLRQPQSGRAGGMGLVSEMNLSAIYRITDVWGFRVGYNLMWVTGVALAPDQFVFSTSQDPGVGSGVSGTGSLFLAGGNLGLEARW
jgi:hypothetical protein